LGDTNTCLEVCCDLPDDLAISDTEIDLLIACLSDLLAEITNERD
jgi:hypothetical protein